MTTKRRRRRSPPAPRYQSDSRYMMRGMMDMQMMAVGGAITAGTIGMVGSLIPKP